MRSGPVPRPKSTVRSPQKETPPPRDGRGGGCWRYPNQKSAAYSWPPCTSLPASKKDSLRLLPGHLLEGNLRPLAAFCAVAASRPDACIQPRPRTTYYALRTDLVPLLVVLIEPLAALAAQQTGLDHLLEQRRGAVLTLAKALVQHLHDGQHGIEADEVGKR